MHQISERGRKQTPKSNQQNNEKMNKNYFTKSLGNITLTTAVINRNFRIKVTGIVDGEKWNKLVGVAGLCYLLGCDWDRVARFALRAMNCLDDKCVCKIYGGAVVTFYAK